MPNGCQLTGTASQITALYGQPRLLGRGMLNAVMSNLAAFLDLQREMPHSMAKIDRKPKWLRWLQPVSPLHRPVAG